MKLINGATYGIIYEDGLALATAACLSKSTGIPNIMMVELWQTCLSQLERELPPQDFNTWVRPLQCGDSQNPLTLLAPNRFVLEWVKQHYLARITSIVTGLQADCRVELDIGTRERAVPRPSAVNPAPSRTPTAAATPPPEKTAVTSKAPPQSAPVPDNLDPTYTFDTFIAGKSNEIARAASEQVALNPCDKHYNPLFIYGGVGLGKTHLMHAIGNHIRKHRDGARVMFVTSERFVSDMVKALQHHSIDVFKNNYRSADVLLIDDIQFLAGKERSQDEFFHTFNELLGRHCQIVMTSDTYPKEIENLDDRLKSRFSWGLSVAVELPDVETRQAILMSKAAASQCDLPPEVAFFISNHIRSHIRDLEGAFRRVMAHSKFMGKPITLEFTKDALKDLIALHDRAISVDNIQKVVAEYYKIRVADLVSKSKKRPLTRPRQLAMALSREFTSESLPSIGGFFGGRDHTTVLHATKKVAELRETDRGFFEDYEKIRQLLSH
ncbi:MAG: chromosomal replication initiator protein DnaA [Pseudomonadota bacterium]|jgi:chromosomal replication initiator protein